LDAVAANGASHDSKISFPENMEKYLFGFLDKFLRKNLHKLLLDNIAILRDYVKEKTGKDLDQFLASKTNKLRDYFLLMAQCNGIKDIDDFL